MTLGDTARKLWRKMLEETTARPIDPLRDYATLAMRYIDLSPRGQARVTVQCLRRLGTLRNGMEPRLLTQDECEQLTEADFTDVLPIYRDRV